MSSSNPMDDRVLAAQWAKTGNLMDLCFDEAWLRAEAQGDGYEDGYIEAGPMMRDYVAHSQTVPPELRQQMRLQSILFTELQRWMTTWELGRSFEATYTQARQLIRQHLQQPTVEQKTWLEALLAEDDQSLNPEQKPVRAQAIAMLANLFTEADWEALATKAAQGMAQGVLQVRQLHPDDPVTV
ncbi:MAG: hypothetical protein AAFX01_13950 [Cyanobacteria bacterium J06638_28]